MHRTLRVFNRIISDSIHGLFTPIDSRHTDPKHWYASSNPYFPNAATCVGIGWCEQTINKSIECGKTR